MSYTTSQSGIELIKSFEGCRLTSYQDVAGIWTIGYGHTGDIRSGMHITKEQAENYLRTDLEKFERCINQYVSVPLTQNMFDALVSFAYNVGTGAFRKSTLLRKLNQGDTDNAAREFSRWVHAGKKICPGLVRRRKEEQKLFLQKTNNKPNNK